MGKIIPFMPKTSPRLGLTIGGIHFPPMQVASVSEFSESPVLADVEIFQGQTQQFKTGLSLAIWGAVLELTPFLEVQDPDAVLSSLLSIEAEAAPVAIAYNGLYDGLYRIFVTASERRRAAHLTHLQVSLQFKGSTRALPPAPIAPPPQAVSPWAAIAKVGTAVERLLKI